MTYEQSVTMLPVGGRHVLGGTWARHRCRTSARTPGSCATPRTVSLRLAPAVGTRPQRRPKTISARHTLNDCEMLAGQLVSYRQRTAADAAARRVWHICRLPSISRQAYASIRFPAKMSTARYFVCVRPVSGCAATKVESSEVR